MSAAHTPAPWTVTDTGVRDVGGYIAFTPKAFHYPNQDERYEKEILERKANARLIAAAPELLQALKCARNELHACQAVIHLAGGFDPAYVSGAQQALKIMDAVINKAEGAPA